MFSQILITIIISIYTVFVKVVLEMQVDLLLAIGHSIVKALLYQLKLCNATQEWMLSCYDT